MAPYVSYGASPRGPISLIGAARALALIRGRDYVLASDMDVLVRDAFRHRLVLSYQALAEEVDADMVLDEVLKIVADAPDRPRSRAPRRREGTRRRRRARADARPPGPGVGQQASRCARSTSRSARRVDGLLAGDYRSAFAGLGSELFQVRPYEAGRRRPPHRLERHRAHRHAARPRRAGRARARHVARVRLVGVDGLRHRRPAQGRRRRGRRARDRPRGHAARQPARAGRVRARRHRSGAARARAGAACCSRSAALRDVPTGKGSLGEALRIVDGLAIQRSLVVVVSDFRGPIDWHQPLLRVAGRHPTVAVEVRDPREQELADVGELRLVDPETGRQLRVDTSSARLRERFAAAAAEEREGLVRLLSSAGVRHVALSTEGDWLRPLAAFLKRSARPR